jgi:hypothetical protein
MNETTEPQAAAEASGSRHDALVSATDMVNHPPHYTSHPSGVECIQITEHMGFCLGNAMKYIWRADLKADAVEDLEKAKWYLERELALRKAR